MRTGLLDAPVTPDTGGVAHRTRSTAFKGVARSQSQRSRAGRQCHRNRVTAPKASSELTGTSGAARRSPAEARAAVEPLQYVDTAQAGGNRHVGYRHPKTPMSRERGPRVDPTPPAAVLHSTVQTAPFNPSVPSPPL